MKVAWGISFVLCLAVVPASAAEQGREAELHLQDGGMLDCVVLGYSDGKLRFATSRGTRSVELAKVDKIVFGKAVGGAAPPRLPPVIHVPTTKPATPGPTQVDPRKVVQLFRWIGRLRIYTDLEKRTDRFRDSDLLKKHESRFKTKLATAPAPSEVNKNVRLALLIIKVAQGKRLEALLTLAKLKKEYPDDPGLQKLTLGVLIRAVERSKRHPLRRPPPRLRPRLDPGAVRPGLKRLRPEAWPLPD